MSLPTYLGSPTHVTVFMLRYHHLNTTFIRDELAFDNSQQACDFLTKHRATFQNPNDPEDKRILDCKQSHASFIQVFEEKYRKAVIVGAI